MDRSKGFLSLLCVASIFLLIYGTTFILRILLGVYLFDGGIMDLIYVYLALLCSVPFVFYLLFRKNQFERVFFISGMLFSVLFVYAQFMLVFSLVEMTTATEIRILTVFPVTALIIVFVSHFICKNEYKIGGRVEV